jgi:hypothetical protein
MHRATPQFDRACALLRDQPIEPVPLARDVKRIARAMGISMATLARARREERVLTIGGRGPGSQPRWLRKTTPHRPRMPTIPDDRFGIDCATYVSAPDHARSLWNPTKAYEILTRSLAGQFQFSFEKNDQPEPVRRDRQYWYYYRYTLRCFPGDLNPEDWMNASVCIQFSPANPDAAALRVSFYSSMEQLLDLDQVDGVLLRLTEALSPLLAYRRADAFWQLAYLESTYDIPITEVCFEQMLPVVQADGIDDSGIDVWPWQQYVQYGSPKSSRFAAMYEKTEDSLAALRTECKFRREYLEEECGIVSNGDLRRVGFSKLFHLRLPEPFESHRRARTRAYESVICGEATGLPTSRTVPFVRRYAAIGSAPIQVDRQLAEKLIATQVRRVVDGKLERFAACPVLDQQDRINYLQPPAPTVAATGGDIDVNGIGTETVESFRALLTRHIRLLIDVERAPQRTTEYPAVVALLDASVQARHALKRWRRSVSLATAERIRDQVQAYLDLVLLAQRSTS